jgi:hypothetical protein
MSKLEQRDPINKKPENSAGPFLAKVISHLDPGYMGTLKVQLFSEVGDSPKAEGQLRQVKYLSPFLGTSSIDYIKDEESYETTQKSYGMWMIPPDVGAMVVVIFIGGDPKRGYWIGGVQDSDMNFMTPGYAATIYTTDEEAEGDKKGRQARIPVAEYNKRTQDQIGTDTTKVKKPKHPFADILKEQGLLLDDIRGITTSSARREWPSAVFGISTPGPIDKNGPKGKVGPKEHENTVYVNRLGGSSFVMDDGDDKFVRKTKPTDGPPEYASVEEDEKGEVTIPHNELIRLRTRTGHQILLHNSEDLIYIGNARGTSWIELTSDGKIDIYAEDSISVHTKNDFNFYSDRDINIECGRNLNIKVAEKMQTEVGKDQILIVDKDQTNHIKGNVNTTIDGNRLDKTGGNYDLNSGGTHKFTSGGDTHVKAANTAVDGGNINLNSGVATEADEAEKPEPLSTHGVPDEEGEELMKTIMHRVPTPEPWPHHENLDPEKFKTDKTDRDVDEDIPVPDAWSVYTTAVDTFSKSKKDE